MTPPKTSDCNESAPASFAGAHGSATRVEECDAAFAAAWATGDDAQIRAALIALHDAVSYPRPLRLQHEETGRMLDWTSDKPIPRGYAICTGPMPADSRDTLDVGPVPPNVPVSDGANHK